jgi:PAS domain S-box-containing protein
MPHRTLRYAQSLLSRSLICSVVFCAVLAVFTPASLAPLAGHVSLICGDGIRAAAINRVTDPAKFAFHPTALQGYGISQSLLAQSTTSFQNESGWIQHIREIGLLAAFVLAETVLIVFVLLEVKAWRRAQNSLTRRLELEQMISEMSSRLAVSPPERIDEEIEAGLKRVMQLENADRACWYQKPEDRDAHERRYCVHKENIPLPPDVVTREETPWVTTQLLAGEAIVLNHIEDLPAKAERDKEFLSKISVKSVALFPSTSGPTSTGLLALASLSSEKQWSLGLASQLGVLASLIASATQRKSAQEGQNESDRRFLRLFLGAPIGIALENLSGGLVFVNPALCNLLGYSADELHGKSCAEFSHPEDVEKEYPLFEQLRQGRIDHYQIQKRFFRKRGGEIWGRVSVSLLKGPNGDSPHVLGMVEDITERRAAEEKLKEAQVDLRRLAGNLMRAQDEERQRISRELHDDIGQRLSLVSLGLDSLENNLSGREAFAQLSKLRDEIEDLATDIHHISHELHSSKLQHLGLAAAVKDLCRNVSQQYGIAIEVSADAQLKHLPFDVALCLYRVAQEALNNVAKHSKSREALVQLTEVAGLVRLRIADRGIGFESSVPSLGIGLASMRERLRTIGGELLIHSRLGEGTEVVAQVHRAELAFAAGTT